MPRCSVVAPCHNVEAFVGRLIDSLLYQTFEDWELVIIDDGSPDRSAEVIAPYAASDRRIHFHRQANAGCVETRNRGFELSDPRSDYLLFFDADDALEPRMLETMVSYLDAHPEVGMAFCEPRWVDAYDRELQYGSPGTRYVPGRVGVKQLPRDEPETPFSALFFWGRINPSISLMRRSVYEQTTGWSRDQEFGCEDLDLWLRLALIAPVHYVPDRLVIRRQHELNHGWVTPMAQQERRLYRRWLEGEWLTPQQRQMVRDTWRIRQRRLLPYLWLLWGTGYLRRGKPIRAAECYLRSGKRVATYAAAAVRGQLPAGPIW